MWTFREAEDYLDKTAPPGTSVYGLGRVSHLIEILGRPGRGIPCITVVGTNGKGTVLAYLESLFREHGILTASHIKPHLESVTERIRIDGTDATEDEFAEYLFEVRDAVAHNWRREDSPTYFELIFAAFMCAAGKNNAQLCLLETGLGGRLDAVNAVDADMVVMTSIGLDHTELLGDTLQKITDEKVVIARPGSILVCQDNPAEVIDRVEKYTEKNEILLIQAGDENFLHCSQDGSWEYRSSFQGVIDKLEPSIRGPYMPSNAGLALLSFEAYVSHVKAGFPVRELSHERIRAGLASARIPGRWEVFSVPEYGATVTLDGAHNPSGLYEILRSFASETRAEGTIIFGMKKGKDVAPVLEWLCNSCGRIIFVPVPWVDSHDPDVLADKVNGIIRSSESLDNIMKFSQIKVDTADSIDEGMKLALNNNGTDKNILVTGSLYLAGAARTFLRLLE